MADPAPMARLETVRTREGLRRRVSAWREAGLRVGLTPTMGALHAGHMSLVRLARERADKVVASLFVNPSQFAPHEDLAAYPRDEAADARLLAEAGCDLLYAPEVGEVYPPGFSTTVRVGGVSAPLEGVARPDHFSGVATVVAKLLIRAAPDVAVFGEKDFQQLQVVRRMAADLDLPVEIVGAPTVRAADGLALSSRNAYLTAEQRRVAPALYAALVEAAASLRKGARVGVVESAAARRVREAGFAAVDYLEVRDPDDLRRLGPGPVTGAARILAAATLGPARLIDNLAV